MAKYTPFPIYDLKSGLKLDKDPWLLPKDAFVDITNGFLYNGILQKRKGFTEYADTEDGNPIIGIMTFMKTDGSGELCIADTKRFFTCDDGVMTDEDGANVWTGGATDFISWVNWQGYLFMANAVDRLRTWNGTATAQPTIDISDDTNNDLDSVAFVAVSKRRLLLFRTEEDGTIYPQRVRWPVPDTIDDWVASGSGYVDAPTSEWIRGITQIGDDFLVWFDKSVWVLRYTGDISNLYKFEKIDSLDGYGLIASFSTDKIPLGSVGLGKSGLLITDSFDIAELDMNIPDITDNFDLSNIAMCFGKTMHKLRQYWLLYPNRDSSSIDRVLVLNYKDSSWSIFRIGVNCLGEWSTDASVGWDDLSMTWAEMEDSWREGSSQAGYPVLLAGGSTGKIYTLNDGDDDAGSDILFSATFGEWNPFVNDGKKARLGYVDFLVDEDESNELKVEFFMDSENIAYMEDTLTFDNINGGSKSKVWKRIYCGTVANSHQIKASHTESDQRVKIHAIVPYFAPKGKLYG